MQKLTVSEIIQLTKLLPSVIRFHELDRYLQISVLYYIQQSSTC